MFQTEVVEKIKAHILCSVTFFFYFFICAISEVMCKNIVEWGGSQMKIWHVCIAY